MNQNKVAAAARVIAEKHDADVILLNGEIERPLDNTFIRNCVARKRRKNVVLVLVTPGGDADPAYRIARCLQDNYENFSVFISGWCKSAGTLLAIGAHRLIIGPCGELGPLDVQINKRDELFDYSSGLDISSALFTLENSAYKMFQDYMLNIKRQSGNQISFKTASEISSGLAIGLLSNIYSQIDPMRIGETSRHMAIARDYGDRLAAKSNNLASDDSLDLLVSSYSSHGFVIDFAEAKELFRNVERPSPDLVALRKALGEHALYPRTPSDGLVYLNDEDGAHETDQEPTDDEAERPATPDEGSSEERQLGPDSEGATRETADSSVSKVASFQRPSVSNRD